MSANLDFFASLSAALDAENEIRDNIRSGVKELDQTCRKLIARLQAVYSAKTSEEITSIATQVQSDLPKVKSCLAVLAAIVPHNELYKYNQAWNLSSQTSIFLVTYTTFLLHSRLPTLTEINLHLGIPVSVSGTDVSFHFALEEYLHAQVSLFSELTRLAITSVTNGDFQRPLTISSFCKSLYSAFQLLNLKNDSLRKRFDSIKYDLKKMEEVVYDLTIRGLAKSPADLAASDMQA